MSKIYFLQAIKPGFFSHPGLCEQLNRAIMKIIKLKILIKVAK